MALTPEQRQLIGNALFEKAGLATLICPASGDTNWEVEDQLAQLVATDNPNETRLGGVNFPEAVVICLTCGYTMMFNVFYLGIAEELGIPPAEEQS